ncbi:MAG: nuclear transport factor 2 family protein [Rhodospirillaceae bacterium]|nr:nuclear transport factor 2 family protein [Rhodospirillaceae bacterium]
MTETSREITRRTAFASLGLGAAALGLAAGMKDAAAHGDKKMSAEEKANAEAVAAFFKSWGGIAPDAMKLTAPIADECYVTVNPGPKDPITSRAALAEAFKAFLTDGQSFQIDILQTVALGPSVYVTRMDWILKNGKRVPEDKGTPAAGLFVFKDGKIKYWHDYAFTPHA